MIMNNLENQRNQYGGGGGERTVGSGQPGAVPVQGQRYHKGRAAEQQLSMTGGHRPIIEIG
jgi:hypothetical protein